MVTEDGAERPVSVSGIDKRRKKGPPQARERTRIEYVAARSENEQDDENPKDAVAL